MNHLVIMAGGVGSRIWPMSTSEKPKQFIDVLGVGSSLLQLTMQRFEGIVAKDNVWVVTNAKYAPLVHEQLPEVPEDHILKEPCRRNTAPCIAYVSWRIRRQDHDANIVVAPSDHIVMNIPEFKRVVSSCLKFTSESDSIVTLGMKPTRPETGYGYIQDDLKAPSAHNHELFEVTSFHEKPDLETAKAYIERGNFFWNAGIFIWSGATIVNAFRIYAPSIAKIFDDIKPILGTPEEQDCIDKVYPECENISVDYAIMEKAEDIFVFPAEFGWNDLGTWGSLHLQMEGDEAGNVVIGDGIELYDTKNSIVHLMGKKRVVVQGLDHYIVAEHDNTLLICQMDQEQRIRQFSGQG